MIAHSRTPSGTPNPMPTLAAEDSPVDSGPCFDVGEDGEPKLPEAVTDADVLFGPGGVTTEEAATVRSCDCGA